MTINVTQKHITDGVRCSSSNCPIAQAILEQTGCEFVAVGVTQVDLDLAGKRYKFDLPVEAVDWILNFDNKWQPRLMQPFSFELPLEVREEAIV